MAPTRQDGNKRGLACTKFVRAELHISGPITRVLGDAEENHRIGGGRNRSRGAVLALGIGGALVSVEGVAMETKANGWIAFPAA